MKTIDQFLLLAVFVLLCGMTMAQEQDARLWTGISTSRKLQSKTKAELSGQLRFHENVSMLQKSLIQIRIRYKINDYLSIAPGYRYIADQDLVMGTLPVHRIFADLNFRYKADPVIVSFRNRYQTEYHDVYAMEDHRYKDVINRCRLKASFDFGKEYQPFVYGEVYYLLNDPLGAMASKYRIAAGSSYQLNDYNEIKAFYIYQHSANTGPYSVNHIFGLMYSIDLEALSGANTKAQDS